MKLHCYKDLLTIALQLTFFINMYANSGVLLNTLKEPIIKIKYFVTLVEFTLSSHLSVIEYCLNK